MKNILAKIVLGFMIVAVFATGLKVSNDILAKADASTNDTNSCGVNNGWIWNGSSCVNTCDAYHPWDSYQRKCSNGFSYSNSPNYTSQNANCSIYGMNFYFDGKSCVQSQTMPNANYYGNPYNGGTQSPVYGNVNFQNLVYQSNNYNVYNNNVTNTNVIPSNPVYYNNNPVNTCSYYCNSDIWNDVGSGAKITYYYIYTITTTTSQPAGIPLYYGNNYSNWPNSYNSAYQNNNQYYSYDYNYDYNYNNGYYY